MVSLQEYEDYWNSIKERVPSIGKVVPLTLDEEMAQYIQGLRSSDLPALFFIIPSSKDESQDADNVEEKNLSVILLMDKTDPQRKKAYQVQKELQPLIESIKNRMRTDKASGHSMMAGLNISSLSTIPESGFFAVFAGWSIGFDFETE